MPTAVGGEWGAFYARFANKEALLEAARLRLAAAPSDESLVRLFADALIDSYCQRRGLLLLLRSGATDSPQIGQRLQALEAAVLLLVGPLRRPTHLEGGGDRLHEAGGCRAGISSSSEGRLMLSIGERPWRHQVAGRC